MRTEHKTQTGWNNTVSLDNSELIVNTSEKLDKVLNIENKVCLLLIAK